MFHASEKWQKILILRIKATVRLGPNIIVCVIIINNFTFLINDWSQIVKTLTTFTESHSIHNPHFPPSQRTALSPQLNYSLLLRRRPLSRRITHSLANRQRRWWRKKFNAIIAGKASMHSTLCAASCRRKRPRPFKGAPGRQSLPRTGPHSLEVSRLITCPPRLICATPCDCSLHFSRQPMSFRARLLRARWFDDEIWPPGLPVESSAQVNCYGVDCNVYRGHSFKVESEADSGRLRGSRL